MTTKLICDNCGVEIKDDDEYVTMTINIGFWKSFDGHRTDSVSEYRSKDFCSQKECVEAAEKYKESETPNRHLW